MTDTEVRQVPTTIAVCSCGEPLVMTFLFPYKEWICLEDGRLYEFLAPNRVDVTADLWNRSLELENEFKEIMRDAIPKDSRKAGCEKCHREDHLAHATVEERRSSDAAFSALHKRVGQT